MLVPVTETDLQSEGMMLYIVDSWMVKLPIMPFSISIQKDSRHIPERLPL